MLPDGGPKVWLASTRRSGGIGRRAWFRSMYPQGCGGSSPLIRTKLQEVIEAEYRRRSRTIPAGCGIPGTQCENGRSRTHSAPMSIFTIILAILAASQAYWAWRGYRLATRLIRDRGRRFLVCGAAAAVYAAAFRWDY